MQIPHVHIKNPVTGAIGRAAGGLQQPEAGVRHQDGIKLRDCNTTYHILLSLPMYLFIYLKDGGERERYQDLFGVHHGRQPLSVAFQKLYQKAKSEKEESALGLPL